MYSQKPMLHARQKAHKPGELRTLSIDVTSKCNMNCPDCYAATFRGKGDVSVSAICSIIKEARDMGVYHFIMQGGEPIMDKDRLYAIIEACNPPESYINVVSNGWEMNYDQIQALRFLGVDKLAYSLDSGICEEHDLNRGPGSFQKVMAAIDMTINSGLLASVSMVVTRKNFDSRGFWAAFFYCVRKEIRMDCQIAEPVGNWDGNCDMLISKEQTDKIRWLRKICPILPNGQKIISRDLFLNDDNSRCPAGAEFMAISSNGHILPCNFVQCSLGKIGEVSLRDARSNLMKSAWFSIPHEHCLCGENQEFISQFITPYVGVKKPLDAVKLFKL